MNDKLFLLSEILDIINEESHANITVVYYESDNKNVGDYFILANTTDPMVAGKIFTIPVECIDDKFEYHDIPFEHSNEVWYYFIDDLNLELLKRLKYINYDSSLSPLIKELYPLKWVHDFVLYNDNINFIKTI